MQKKKKTEINIQLNKLISDIDNHFPNHRKFSNNNYILKQLIATVIGFKY